ncbi:MAG: prepilin-type N-terminal cleavage/methylation domain-containing protein, partial [Verrucomicrobia bacterium]|nr:prepilin-type N-terminal cleavage/methylation domain-containing protein [Verrucomicrobiota bacterium]
KIRFPYTRSRKAGMTLSEMLVCLACLVVALLVAGFLGSSHHWVVGVVSLPLGFCAAAAIFGLLGEVAVRRGYSRMGRTPGTAIRRSVVAGSVAGFALGLSFYSLVALGTIPTAAGWHSSLASAAVFGASVALTVVFFLMLRHGHQ